MAWTIRGEDDPALNADLEAELGPRVLNPLYRENQPGHSEMTVTRTAALAGAARLPTYYPDLQQIRASLGPGWSDQACRELAGARQGARQLAARQGAAWGTWEPLPARSEPGGDEHLGATALPQETDLEAEA
jgi:hypothetical protein